MCGRLASSLPPDRLREIFATFGAVPNHAPSWNVAPTQSALVVRRHPETGDRRLDALHWGLVPSFHKGTLKTARCPINARSETASTSPMFRGALQSRRCLVPADAFYEWRTQPDGKQPFAFARQDGEAIAFAGLWEGWRSAEGEVVRSFAILTTAANATMAPIHDRMPVILERSAWPLWLGEETGDAAALMRAAAVDVLRLWPVSRNVNSPRHDRADLLEPVELPTVPRDDREAGPDSV